MYNLPSNKNLEKLYKLFVKLNWGLAFILAFLCLIYLIALLTGKAGLPVSGDTTFIEAIGSCLVISGLPLLGLWLGKTYNMAQAKDGDVPRGYHKGSELFWNCLVFPFTILALRSYYIDIVPRILLRSIRFLR